MGTPWVVGIPNSLLAQVPIFCISFKRGLLRNKGGCSTMIPHKMLHDVHKAATLVIPTIQIVKYDFLAIINMSLSLSSPLGCQDPAGDHCKGPNTGKNKTPGAKTQQPRDWLCSVLALTCFDHFDQFISNFCSRNRLSQQPKILVKRKTSYDPQSFFKPSHAFCWARSGLTRHSSSVARAARIATPRKVEPPKRLGSGRSAT